MKTITLEIPHPEIRENIFSEQKDRSRALINKEEVLRAIITCDDAGTDLAHLYEVIENITPTKSEPLTDREQRIFLAAMCREMKVCKEVDEEYPRKDSLVKVCKEIERKVKGALWN